MLQQRCARTTSSVVRMDVKHINTADVIKSVIQNAITDNLFVCNSDKAIAGNDFPTDKIPTFILTLRDEVKRAKSVNVIFDGWTNRNHISLNAQEYASLLQRGSGLTLGITRRAHNATTAKSRG